MKLAPPGFLYSEEIQYMIGRGVVSSSLNHRHLTYSALSANSILIYQFIVTFIGIAIHSIVIPYIKFLKNFFIL